MHNYFIVLIDDIIIIHAHLKSVEQNIFMLKIDLQNRLLY